MLDELDKSMKLTAVGIINYGVGNVGSVERALSRVGTASTLISHPDELSRFSKIILPGVGRFDFAMARLRETQLDVAIQEFAKNHENQILGICLGMQLLCSSSEEGNVEGLGLVESSVKKFEFDSGESIPVPHMGWNEVKAVGPPVLFSSGEGADYYFAHTYYVPYSPTLTSGITVHGIPFSSVIRSVNIHGVQFHPEKSHAQGREILRSFCAIV